MLLAVAALVFFIVIQLLCCLKGKRKLTKALPLLLAVFLIGVLFALAVLREGRSDALDFALSVCYLALHGFLLGWSVYGAILRRRGQGGKVLGWSLAILLLVLVGTVVAWWHESQIYDPYIYNSNSDYISEAVDRLEIYTFDGTPENSRLIRTVTDPARIERYVNAYRWEDWNAIGCDEATRYIICQYIGGQMVGASRYSHLLSGYNNYAFNAQQLMLILFP